MNEMWSPLGKKLDSVEEDGWIMEHWYSGINTIREACTKCRGNRERSN
jgi:hypothetical protein